MTTAPPPVPMTTDIFGRPLVPKPADLGFDPERYPDWRNQQPDVMHKLLAWYGNPPQRKVLILEAPTGWGKSLIAAALHRILSLREGRDYHGIITTTTINLQQQYADATLGELGRTAWGRASHNCLVLPQVTVDEGPCTHGFTCPRRKECTYYADRDMAHVAQIAVLNTAFWLTCVNYARLPLELATTKRNPQVFEQGPQAREFLYDNADLVIHDEAHLLERSVQGLVEARLSKRFFRDIKHPVPQTSEYGSWQEWIQSCYQTVQDIAHAYSAEAQRLAKQGEVYVDPDGKRAVSALKNLDRISNELLPTRPLIDTSDNESVSFRAVWGTKFAPEYVFNKGKRHILMSASIPNPRYLAETLGLRDEEWEFLRLPSLFHPARRRIMYDGVVKVNARSTRQDYARLILKMDEYLDKHPRQKGIIHSVSYERMRMILQLSSHRNRMITHGKGRGDKARAIAMFLDAEDPVILVSPSVGVGEDFGRGDNCRFQVFVKYPVPNMQDPVVKARVEENPDSLWIEADMAFIQAVGRGMRDEDDYCVSYVLDKQAAWRLRQMPQYIKDAIVQP